MRNYGSSMTALLLQVGIAWLVQVMLPGPNFLVVSQQAARHGRRSAILTVLGISTGAAIWATSALVGFAAVMATSGSLLGVLRVVGGLVIVWFGLRLFKPRADQAPTAESPASRSAYVRGIVTSLSNPKAAVYFASLFVAAIPSEVSRSAGLLVVLTIAVVSIAWYGTVAFVLSNEHARAVYARAATAIDRVAGVIFVVLGGRLVLQGSK